MSETTEILFNSPALHALKREQLQKLCKLHAIKANGKNSEIIQRLKRHARTLPNDDPLSIAARSESTPFSPHPLSNSSDTSPDDAELGHVPRPSEQWEIVMESIQEVEESGSSQGTLSSLRTPGRSGSGEFGTSTSKSSTVGSSIKAFATSLGLKRTDKSNSSSASSKASVTAAAQEEQLNDDELTQHSIPYAAVQPATPPLNDNFTFDPTTAPHTRMSFASNGDPLPGCSLRPGVPAPDNARLSLGLGLTPNAADTPTTTTTTTIRLVSANSEDNISQADKPTEVFQTPKLKPFKTTFDLVMSPGGATSDAAAAAAGGDFWAPDVRPGGFQSLYPTLTIDDLPPVLPPSPIKPGVDKTAPGSLTMDTNTNTSTNTLAVPTATTSTTTTTRKSLTPDPFIFGSSLPQHSVSNTQFKAVAVDVLEEMNKRLRLSGVEGVGMDIIEKLKPGEHTKEDIERELKPLPNRVGNGGGRRGGGEITKKFDEVHKSEFDKMEGIDGTARRRGGMGGSTALEVPPLVVGKKRKSSVFGGPDGKPRRPTTGPGAIGAVGVGGGKTSGTTRVISNGRRGKVLPGSFDDEGEGDEEEGFGVDERGGKRARTNLDTDGDPNTIITDTTANGNTKGKGEDAMDVDDDEDQEEKKNQSHRDREREVIKRKLEMSRAKRRSSAGGPVAAAAARRKSGRPSVAQNTPKSKPSRFGFLTSAKKLVASVWGRGKAAVAAPPGTPTPVTAASGVTKSTNKTEMTKKSSLVKKKTILGFAPAKTSTTAAGTCGSSMGTGTANSRLSAATASSSTRSRSPIPPSFKPNTASNRVSSVRMSSVGGSRISRGSAVASAGGGVSSMGTRLSTTSNSGVGVGSMGVKKDGGQLRTSSMGSSRLLAPTASSLAKTRKLDSMSGGSRSGSASSSPAVTNAGSAKGHKKKPSLLGAITNSPKVQRKGVLSPPSSRIGSSSGLALWSIKSPNNNTPKKIFSKPVTVHGVSGIPVLAKKSEDGDVVMADGEGDSGGKPPPGTVTRQRTMTRKPRISRSKVIARLASQRAAASSSSSSSRTPKNENGGVPFTPHSRRPLPPSVGMKLEASGRRTRSSFGARRGRMSILGSGSGALLTPSGGGGGGGGKGERERNVIASAKKRVRQSEIARRRMSRGSGVLKRD